jgi:hypothetical protein
MTLVAPPPVLDCARVIAYAHIGPSIPCLAKSLLYVGGNLLGRVPALAICENLGTDLGPLLFHCDGQWNVLGSSGAETIEAAVLAAERNYPGLQKHWVWPNTTVETALAYYDATFSGRCSFCGKRAYEVSGLVESENSCICRSCVEKFFHGFSSSETEPPAA